MFLWRLVPASLLLGQDFGLRIERSQGRLKASITGFEIDIQDPENLASIVHQETFGRMVSVLQEQAATPRDQLSLWNELNRKETIMKLGLKDKVALVTGASKGIGKAIALALASEGCRVVIGARGKEDLETVATEIHAAGSLVQAVAADVTKAGDTQKLVDEAVAKFGTIHILVNNAGGIGSFSPFDQLKDDDWLDVFNLNVLSTVRVTRAALPYMQKQKWGRIINMASESGIQPDPVMPHYNASKAALINLTKSLSKAYAKDGVLVNVVSPAFIRTPLVDDLLAERAKSLGVTVKEAEADFLRENRPNIVLGRAGESEEIASVVVFLASEAASFVTGANYRIDGGSVASIN